MSAEALVKQPLVVADQHPCCLLRDFFRACVEPGAVPAKDVLQRTNAALVPQSGSKLGKRALFSDKPDLSLRGLFTFAAGRA
jgi:hypothetical protein